MVVFSAAGRCSEDGLMLPAKVTAPRLRDCSRTSRASQAPSATSKIRSTRVWLFKLS